MTDSELLRGMRKLLTPEGAWCQGARARLASGLSCQATDWKAQSWCLLGAVEKVTGLLLYSVAQAPPALLAAGNPIAFNDRPGRTQAEILAFLDEKIACEMVAEGAKEAEEKTEMSAV